MFFCLFLLEFIAFPARNDAIISTESSRMNVNVESSGSSGFYYDGKCHLTAPNETLNSDKKRDWCSNIAKGENDKPWIEYSLKNKAMKLTGYSLRSGCCFYDCCCVDDNDILFHCCCELYSFSLQASNDNRTWKTIHKVEKDQEFYICLFKTYEFAKTEAFKYVRIVQDESVPGCRFCMALNQVELYGEAVDSYGEEQEENEESVSIIGKVKRDSV